MSRTDFGETNLGSSASTERDRNILRASSVDSLHVIISHYRKSGLLLSAETAFGRPSLRPLSIFR